MKYLPLIWAGIWRKRSRAVLMLLQITSAFALFGLLQGLDSGVKQVIAHAHGDRLYVASSVSMQDELPMGLLPRIRSIDGVEYATERTNFGGTYQKPNQFVPIIASDPDTFFKIYNEVMVKPESVAALRNDRTGAIVGVELMKRYGWKIGDRFVLQSPLPKSDGSRDWTFDILGTYDVPRDNGDSPIAAFANFSYLNEARLTGRDRTSLFVVKIGSPARAASIGSAIDSAFANSDHETRTQSEGDLIATQVQQTVDLDFMVRGIIGAVFFALLLATGALLMQSIRERVSELAVLKTVGFTDRLIMVIILAEAATLCLLAAAIGLGISAAVFPLVRSQIGIAHLPLLVIVSGIAMALLVALVSGSAPAVRASRLSVATALADR
jgi:putative ABC transport system permease protein